MKTDNEPGRFRSLPLVQIHIGFLADQVRVAASDTFYLRQGVHDLLLAVDIGIKESEDELEVRFLSRDERCANISAVTWSLHQPVRVEVGKKGDRTYT